MDKKALIEKIKTLEGLDNTEKAALLGLLNSHKKYGLVWEEKAENVEERLREEIPVLTEVKERAIISNNAEAPNHILIEGDNLEALTALSYTHEGAVDVIYIDPPYNTGNKDFVYNDKFVDTEDEYRHSKWLSFIRKRLVIAKKILSENGVCFISIGSDELAQLILLCNELFLEQNQIAIISRVQKKGNGKGTHFSPAIDYILVYAKNKLLVDRFFAPNTSEFPCIETEGDRQGEYYECSKSLFQASLDSRPNQRYYIECPDGSLIIPPGNVFPETKGDACFVKPESNQDKCWRWSWESYLTKKDLLVFKKTTRGTLVDENNNRSIWNVYTKRYQKDAEEKGKVPPNYIDDCINSLGTSRLSDIGLDFSFSKPTDLIIKILEYTNKNREIIVLDFFAGSGTTLDAVMQLNNIDKGCRKCILVTNNENNICEEVTYERNKKVITGYTTPKGEKIDGLTDNTLRYYRTDFLPRERSPRNMRALVSAATDLLCIKEDLYNEEQYFGSLKTHPKLMRYFVDGKKQMLVLYNEEAVYEIAEEIKTMSFNGKLKLYIFSAGRYAYNDDFFEVQDKVELVALPAAIYDAYAKVLPKQKVKYLNQEDAEQEKELTLFEEEDEQ